jgi:hydrophobe/amphiphile efflux-1 (HAE1) family protein
MSLPRISIEKPVFAWMLMASILLFGYFGLNRLGVGLLPDVDFPQVSVSISFPGASPELIESDITDLVEGALVGVEGVRNMYSNSRFGSSSITLEFDLDRNIDAAIQDVQSALQGVMRRLPEDTEPPIVNKSNPEDRPILWLALSGKGKSPREINAYARNFIRDRFSSVEGVSEVMLGGALDPQIRVWLDPQKLERLQLTPGDVIATIQSEHIEIPAGRILQEKTETNLRILGEAMTPEELARIPITRRSGAPVYETIRIGELGRVEAGLEDARRLSRTNGEFSVGIGIKKQRGANAVAIAEQVRARMSELKLAPGYELGINFDTTKAIKESVEELKVTLIISVLLTAFVCWLFLGSIASTLNVIFSIPTSLFGTFLVISLWGFTLNSFTMLALILVIGIVVDDTIMVLENIMRFREEGESPIKAALKGAEQIAPAATATTLAILAIFLPIVFVEGLTGAFLFQFGVTLSVAVAWSLLEALTFTPMRLSRSGPHKAPTGIPLLVDKGIRRFSEHYKNFLKKFLHRPWPIYLVATLIFLSSLALIKVIPKEFTPATDSGSVMIRAELPLGINITEAAKEFEAVEKIIQSQKEVEKLYSIIGGFGGSEVNNANFMVTLVDASKRERSQQEVEDELRKEFRKLGKRFQVRIQNAGGATFGGRRGYPVELNVKGPDWKQLVVSSKHLEDELAKDPHFTDVDSSYQEGSPEFHVIPNREAANARGISMDVLSETLQVIYQGVMAGRFNDEGRRSDIVVQADPKHAPHTPEELGKLFIRNNRGNPVPLRELVRIVERKSAVTITRENRERKIGVYSNVSTGYSQEHAIERALEIGAKVLPKDVILEPTGSSQEMKKTFASMIFALLMGIVVAYMVLASQYNSYVHPFTILLALPFSVTGAWLALYLGGSSINIYSMIGLLLLMGLVKKNSILLVEFSNELRHSGKAVDDAILEACQTRMRPILMTSFSTMAAAVPPALAIGHSSASSQPMALVILGGVFFSTFLTLLVVPVAYRHLVKVERLVDPQ